MTSGIWKKRYARENATAPASRRFKTAEQLEEEQRFADKKAKYANVIAYLLITGIRQSELRDYFKSTEDNKKRYERVKKIRQDIIDARPKAKQYVDKSFYIGIKLGEATTLDDGTISTQIIVSDSLFKHASKVISDRNELDGYMATIAKIIESERLWNDPDMVDFDVGEREDISAKIIKKSQKSPQEREPIDPLEEEKRGDEKGNNEGDTLMLESVEGESIEDSQDSSKCMIMTRARAKESLVV